MIADAILKYIFKPVIVETTEIAREFAKTHAAKTLYVALYTVYKLAVEQSEKSDKQPPASSETTSTKPVYDLDPSTFYTKRKFSEINQCLTSTAYDLIARVKQQLETRSLKLTFYSPNQ